MIEGKEEHRCHVTFFKASGKFYASGDILFPDHWEVCGGDADALLRYIAARNPAVNSASVLRREFCMVLDPCQEVHDNPGVRYLYPRMVPAL